MALTATKVKSITKPGTHGDGDGLYLSVSGAGSKSWLLRKVVDRRRREYGLGGFPDVSLAAARTKAAEYRSAIAEGKEPRPRSEV